MKRPVLFLAAVCLGLSAAAQDGIHAWNKWCSSKDTMLLFTTANNEIHLYGANFKPADVTLKSLDKTLRIGTPEIKGDTMTVLAMPYPQAGKPMRLAVVDNKTRKTIKTINCYSDNLPMLEARIGTLAGPEATKKDILSQMTLKASFPKSLYSYPYKIKQYTFKITTPKGATILTVNSAFLSKEVLAEINNAPAGTELLFTNIKATCPECATRDVADIKMKVR
ncbi:MAG: GldM family protein [Bacteroidota bacterium]